MRYIKSKKAKVSYVSWIKNEERIRTENFKSKDGFTPDFIVIKTDGYKYIVAHEIGHILTAKYHNLDCFGRKYFKCGIEYFRVEVMAWRIAKSFVKPKYWNEDHAIDCLKTYSEGLKINWKKFRIVELNKGVSIS